MTARSNARRPRSAPHAPATASPPPAAEPRSLLFDRCPACGDVIGDGFPCDCDLGDGGVPTVPLPLDDPDDPDDPEESNAWDDLVRVGEDYPAGD